MTALILKVASLVAICCVTGCSTPPPALPGLKIDLPANMLVKVVIKSTNCDAVQKTVIHWPDGSDNTFETPSPAGTNGTMEYGSMTYQTGSASSQALVEVFSKPPKKLYLLWSASQTRVEPDKKTVTAEGHPGPTNQNWTDSIVTFSW